MPCFSSLASQASRRCSHVKVRLAAPHLLKQSTICSRETVCLISYRRAARKLECLECVCQHTVHIECEGVRQ